MKRFLAGRAEAFGALGQAAADLARAEGEALRGELRGEARRLLGITLLVLFALFVVFWALGGLAFALVEIGALWLPRWGAALVLVGFLLLVAALLALVARRRLARLENPAALVKRRAREAREWWAERIGGPPPRDPASRRGREPAAEEVNPRVDA